MPRHGRIVRRPHPPARRRLVRSAARLRRGGSSRASPPSKRTSAGCEEVHAIIPAAPAGRPTPGSSDAFRVGSIPVGGGGDPATSNRHEIRPITTSSPGTRSPLLKRSPSHERPVLEPRSLSSTRSRWSPSRAWKRQKRIRLRARSDCPDRDPKGGATWPGLEQDRSWLPSPTVVNLPRTEQFCLIPEAPTLRLDSTGGSRHSGAAVCSAPPTRGHRTRCTF